MKLSDREWKEFKIGELFDIHPTKTYKMTNRDLFKEDGVSPVVVNSSANNGIGGYSSLACTETGNMVTFSDTTDDKTIFYQENDFIGYSHIQGLYPKHPYSDEWNKNTYLYFITQFKKIASQKGFNYGNKFRRDIALLLEVRLPVTKDNKIDYQFMQEYIQELEQEYIQELEQEYIQELDLYLKAAGLDNYEITDKDREILNKSEQLEWKEFKIGELFDVGNSKKRINANTIKFEGEYPYVARGSTNNGIKGYISCNEDYLNSPNTISFGQDTATAFFQSKPYFTGDKIKILKLKNEKLNSRLALNLITTIKKSFSLYQWGSSSFSEEVIKNENILLPVTPDGTPDYQFMENYIKVIEKLVISDVVKFKNDYIEKAKEAVK